METIDNQLGQVDLPPALADAMAGEAEAWTSGGRLGRLWQRDSTIWTGQGEGQWLGWLDIPVPGGAESRRLASLCAHAARDDLRDVALLGMGGSSLFPELLRRVFGRRSGLGLHVLDSTDPAQVRTFAASLDPDRTLVIVSSKSGTTLETTLFLRYMLDRLRVRLGVRAASRVVAVTDAGSALDELAAAEGFGAVFHGEASTGGRYSALSYFGLVPAAVMGLDVDTLLGRAHGMAAGCGVASPAADNPGVQLGLLLGLAAQSGRDKLTLVVSPRLDGVGAWIEQLIAESTGKQGHGIVPIDGEALAEPSSYGDDRLFVSIALADDADDARDAALDRLAAAGHPVVHYALRDPFDVAAECFRWMFATAVAGAVMGVNPFDQPDVEASKAATRALTHGGGQRRAVGSPVARFDHDRGTLTAWVSGPHAAALRRAAGSDGSIERLVATHLRDMRAGDYVALLAYVEMNERHRAQLDRIRHDIRRVTGVATTIGFGPRFLHSTGQLHKGGPASGRFLVITSRDAGGDVAIPEHPLSFGAVRDAQARGDCAVLAARRRRCLRLEIDGNVDAGLETIASLVAGALT